MKVAFFTPLAPVRSGISSYCEQLLPRLHDQLDIDIYVDGFTPTHPVIANNFAIKDHSAFPKGGQGYDLVVYQMGNYTPYHEYMYHEMMRTPGLVVLHDTVYFHFYRGLTLARGDEDGFRDIMRYCYGEAGFQEIRFALSDEVRGFRYTMTSKMLDSSLAAVVHSESAEAQLRADRPDARIYRIPMGVAATFSPGPQELARLREYHGIGEEDFIVGSFGNITPFKRIDVALSAFADFVRDFPSARYIIVGDLSSQFTIKDIVRKLDIEGNVIVAGHAGETAFRTYKYLCDFCIGLRYPTAGETSLSILELMEAGKVVAVSNYAQFGELPDDCVVKVDFHTREKEILADYMRLLAADPELRRKIGANAREYVHRHQSLESAAAGYLYAIRNCAGNTGDTQLQRIKAETGTLLSGLAGPPFLQKLESEVNGVLSQLGVAPVTEDVARSPSPRLQLSRVRYALRRVKHHGRKNGKMSSLRMLRDKLAARVKLPRGLARRPYIPRAGRKCKQLFEEVCILPDGRVVCSCCDGLAFDVLGDINEAPIAEIFNGFRYQRRRHELISNTVPRQCFTCGLRVYPIDRDDRMEMPRIKRLQIENVNACNLKCPQCIVTTHDRSNQRSRVMPYDTFTDIIDQLKGELEEVKFYNYGEPFLHRDCMRMLRYIKAADPGISISISTNGLLIDTPRQKELVDLNVDVILLSVDGASQETYGRYRVNGSFSDVVENMRGLIAHRDERKRERPRVYWQYILFEWNDSDDEIQKAKELACDVGVDSLLWVLTHTEGASRRFVPGSPLLSTLCERNGLSGERTRFVFQASDGPIDGGAEKHIAETRYGNEPSSRARPRRQKKQSA